MAIDLRGAAHTIVIRDDDADLAVAAAASYTTPVFNVPGEGFALDFSLVGDSANSVVTIVLHGGNYFTGTIQAATLPDLSPQPAAADMPSTGAGDITTLTRFTLNVSNANFAFGQVEFAVTVDDITISDVVLRAAP